MKAREPPSILITSHRCSRDQSHPSSRVTGAGAATSGPHKLLPVLRLHHARERVCKRPPLGPAGTYHRRLPYFTTRPPGFRTRPDGAFPAAHRRLTCCFFFQSRRAYGGTLPPNVCRLCLHRFRERSVPPCAHDRGLAPGRGLYPLLLDHPLNPLEKRMRRCYLVFYDIRNPKRLRHVHQVMKGYGEPWQYSVFFCVLKNIDRVRMQSDLEDEMNLKEDQTMILDLGGDQEDVRDTVSVLGQSLPPQDGGAVVV